MTRPRGAGDDWRGAAALAGGLAALYVWLSSPSFGPGDSAQHVLSALTWGVSRPPGYPLYVSLGWLASRLVPGPAAVNALSGLFQAGAAGFFFLALRRLGCGRPAALTAAGLMSLSPLFWYYAEVAEVRALNNLLACAAVYAALAWRDDRRPRTLAALGAVLGLGLSHHPTFILILPPLAWLLRRSGLDRRSALRLAGVAAAFAVLPYALLWARLRVGAPAYNPDGVSGARDVLALWLRRDTGGPLRMFSGSGLTASGGFDLAALGAHAGWFARSLLADVVGVATLLAALAVAAGRRDRSPGAREAVAFWLFWLAAAAGPYILISSQQAFSADRYFRALSARYYLLPQIAVFALAGLGVERLAPLCRPGLIPALAAATLLAPPLIRPVSLRRHEPLRRYAEELLGATGERDILVASADDTIAALLCLDKGLGRAGGRVLLFPPMFGSPAYRRELAARHPDLRLPLGRAGLRTDWAQWLRLNPGRRLFLENTVPRSLSGGDPRLAPVRSLAEALRPGARPPDPLRGASEFLAQESLGRLTRGDVYEFTQESYLLDVAARQAGWYGSLLEARGGPEALLDRLRLRILEVGAADGPR